MRAEYKTRLRADNARGLTRVPFTLDFYIYSAQFFLPLAPSRRVTAWREGSPDPPRSSAAAFLI